MVQKDKSNSVQLEQMDMFSFWGVMPPHTQQFLLKRPDLIGIFALGKFWFNLVMIDNTRTD